MIGPVLRRAEAGRLPSRREILLMLQAEGSEYRALLETARQLCHRFKGEELTLRGKVIVYGGEEDKSVLEEARTARRFGCTAVVIHEAEPGVPVERIAGLIRQIKEQLGLHVALCLGLRSYEAYATWRQAGADEYVLPHECSNPAIYAQLHAGRSPAERLTCYLWLKGLGYRVTGGIQVGLPGQTKEILADDLEILRNTDVSAVAIRPVGEEHDALRLVAIARLCLPQADLWLSTESPMLQSQAVSCGANLMVGLLPGLTPEVGVDPVSVASAL